MRIAMIGLRAVGQSGDGAGTSAPDERLDLFSGVEKAVEEVGRRLASRGHEVTVFCRRRYNLSGASSFAGMRLLSLPAVYTKHLEAISHTALAAAAATRGYDIVHFHATGPSLFAFLPRLCGRKVVATVHGLDWRRAKWGLFARSVLRAGAWAAGRFPHRTIVVSRTLQRHYRERYGRDADYIPNGISAGPPAPLERLARFGVRGGDYVLFLGRLVPEKGCHLLVRAFRETDTAQRLLIAGGGSYSDRYVRALRQAAEGDERIVFAGALHGRDKAEAYSNASLLAMPSSLEGMPLVMLEAMSYGCPVLCSDIPEHMDVIAPAADGGAAAAPPGMYAFCFENGSKDALRRRLQDLLARPEAARATGRLARAYALGNFSWDRSADLTERVYGELVDAA